MAHIKDIDKDEIRNGFLVTTDRKKIWNKLLELLAEVDRICQKYDIRYFANAGTLIGAVRHKGFIPWDDDIDVVMLRPDYEKFKQVAEKELQKPFIISTTYNSGNLLFVAKIMNENTAAIEKIEGTHPQGIFMDIWPYDDSYDDSLRSQEVWEIRQCLLAAMMSPDGVLKHIDEGMEFKPSNEFMRNYINMPHVEQFREYEKFCINHFGESENVGFPMGKSLGAKGNLKRSYYRDVVYLDFENTKIPAPIDYEKVLNAEFGDWHKFIRSKSLHATEYVSADISYKDIKAKVNYMLRMVEK